MGLPISLLGSLDRVFNSFEDVKDFDAFHEKFIDLCSLFNEIMPGEHYIIKKDAEGLKKFFDKWKDTKEDKKGQLVKFISNRVEIYKPSSSLMITTGCVAPAAAILLKRSGEKVPQLKKLRIDLVPNFVIVPGVTLLSLIGVRISGLRTAASRISNKT